MKLIILAAGLGSRLRPLTDDKPKSMVPFFGKPILSYILDAAATVSLDSIAIVTGYKKDVISKYIETRQQQVIKLFHNERYSETNMVYSLFCAHEFMDDDLLISYADIIYNPQLLTLLMKNSTDFCMATDKQWRELWQMRMETDAAILADAEVLKLSSSGNIVKIGQRPESFSDIEGQYIGLIKIKRQALERVKAFYQELDSTQQDKLDMTTFIQMLIDNNIVEITATPINGHWIEVDSLQDLTVYHQHAQQLSTRLGFELA